jgi:hypothetical protein
MQWKFDIGWAIVYIRGRDGFQADVLARLREKYLSGNSEADNVMMVWVPGVNKLRSLKMAIGGRTILKYRLHFFMSLDSHPGSAAKRATALSGIESEIVNPMVVW